MISQDKLASSTKSLLHITASQTCSELKETQPHTINTLANNHHYTHHDASLADSHNYSNCHDAEGSDTHLDQDESHNRTHSLHTGVETRVHHAGKQTAAMSGKHVCS